VVHTNEEKYSHRCTVCTGLARHVAVSASATELKEERNKEYVVERNME
jgi:hypothetical protein